MLSLKPESSQKQLDTLDQFCNDWGIEVNDLKTQVMIFERNNKSTSTNNHAFLLKGKALDIVETYCYLGIVLHSTGELRTAQSTLKTKAMRAFFGLKRTVIRSKLSFKSLAILFDSLIKPIVLYGAPIWTPSSATNKSIIKYCSVNPTNVQNFISKINRSISEKVHLSFLKWSLGVHRKASNVGVWGETGRYPIIYQAIRLTLNYYKQLLKAPKNSFVYAALKEQKKLKLPWYKNIEPILKLDEVYHLNHVTAHRTIKCKSRCDPPNTEPVSSSWNGPQLSNKSKPLPSEKFRVLKVLNTLTKHFTNCWDHEKSSSSKLSYYNNIKKKFAREVYLDITKGFSRRYSTSKLRISSHDLAIECGRYSNTPRELRTCHWCKSCMGTEILEDENHVMHECDLYSDIRAKLIARLRNAPYIQTQSESNNLRANPDINNQTLKSNIMTFLSPHTVPDIDHTGTNLFNIHHKIKIDRNPSNTTQDQASLTHRRSYIVNCVCTFIYRVLDKRNKYMKDVRERETQLNTIVIDFTN